MSGKHLPPRGRRKPRSPGFWEIAEYFRDAEDEGWTGGCIGFHREVALSGGGRAWRVCMSIGLDRPHDRIACASVCISEGDEHRADRASALRPGLFAFMRAAERKLNGLGYDGCFRAELMGASFDGYFIKRLRSMGAIRRERASMNALKLGKRRTPRIAGSPGKPRASA